VNSSSLLANINIHANSMDIKENISWLYAEMGSWISVGMIHDKYHRRKVVAILSRINTARQIGVLRVS
jgi:hypothetical protein